MRIDQPDPAEDGDDANTARRDQALPDEPDVAGKERGTTGASDGARDSYPARPDPAVRMKQAAEYKAKVDAIYQQRASDHGHDRQENLEQKTPASAMRGIGTKDPESTPADLDEHLEATGRLVDGADLRRGETPEASGGDVPDDPRNYCNPKTGRFDASWSTYDRAVAASREHVGEDLGPNSVKMYDYNPRTGEGTGTLIGEQTPDRLRGWRIDGRDGHVNWWDWTGGKKGAGGVYGHDWFPEGPAVPGSRYIGWAPWQDSDGNILEGN